MCKVYCFKKLAEMSKKYKLSCILKNDGTDMLNRPLNKNLILDFVNNADLCKNCKNNTMQNQF